MGVLRTPFAPKAVLLRAQLPDNSVVEAPAPGAIGVIRIGRAMRAVRTEAVLLREQLPADSVVGAPAPGANTGNTGTEIRLSR